MKKILVASALSMIVACGGAKPVPGGADTSAVDQAPSWLSQGSGAFAGESGKLLQGVGVTGEGVRDPKTRRLQADGKARVELAKSVDMLMRSLAKMSESTKENASEELTAIGKKAAKDVSEIRDHWVQDGVENSLEVLDLDAFKKAIARAEGDEKLKKELVNNLDRAFDQQSK